MQNEVHACNGIRQRLVHREHTAMTLRTAYRSFFNHCVAGRGECSARQMRGGLFVLNLLAWAIIFTAVRILA